MALIDLEQSTYFKVNLESCYIKDGNLFIDYQIFFNKYERDKEKKLLSELKLFDLTEITNKLESLDESRYNLNKDYYDGLFNEFQEKRAFNHFFENKLYLTNNLNFEKEDYIKVFEKYNLDYLDLIYNPIMLSGHIIYKCENYSGELDYSSVYSELKKYLNEPVDDV
jgi:hypothetical protein